jgi:hypothetical protein
MPVNREWLEERMAELGITTHALRHQFHVSLDNILKWDEGVRPRPDTLRRLADALQVTYVDLVRKLRVGPGDFSEVGVALAAARLNKPKKKKRV